MSPLNFLPAASRDLAAGSLAGLGPACTWTWTSTHIHGKMIPSRGFQAIRGVAPRLYQQKCRNVNIHSLTYIQSTYHTNTRTQLSSRTLPEPPPSPLLVLLIAYSAIRNGDHEPLVSPPQSPPSDTPPQLPRPRLRRHPSIPPTPLPTTLTPSHSTMSKSPPPAMPLAA